MLGIVGFHRLRDVCVTPDILLSNTGYPALSDVSAQRSYQYAGILEEWKNGAPIPAIFGGEAKWEDNKRLENSFVYRIHIRLLNEKP